MKHKRPAFQFYPKDWLTDIHIIRMTATQRGGHINLLAHLWLEDCYLEKDMKTFESITGLKGEDLAVVLSCYKEEDGKIFNHRLLEEKIELDRFIKERSDAGKKGNEVRWRKNKDNKESIAKQSLSDTKAITKHRSSSSTSSSIPTSTSTSFSTPSASSSIEEDEIFKILKKWLKGIRSVENPTGYAKKLMKEYPLNHLKRALNDNCCTSLKNLAELCKTYEKQKEEPKVFEEKEEEIKSEEGNKNNLGKSKLVSPKSESNKEFLGLLTKLKVDKPWDTVFKYAVRFGDEVVIKAMKEYGNVVETLVDFEGHCLDIEDELKDLHKNKKER